MGHFVSQDKIYISESDVSTSVPEEGVEWIAIKPKLSLGDRENLGNALVRVAGPDTDELSAEVRAGSMLAVMLDLAIVDWYLVGENGNPVRFRKARIRELDQDSPLVDKVLAEVSKRNPTLGANAGSPGSES